MSDMIKCDGCGKLMYADSRSNKGDYHFITIDGSSFYHLCRKCFDHMMRTVFHMKWDENDMQYVEEEHDE